MPIVFEYQCEGCQNVKSNKDLESFVCGCGGTFHLIDRGLIEKTPYEIHYDPLHNRHITSWKEKEKLGKEYRSKEHPKGLYLWQSKPELMRKAKQEQKHKEDMAQEAYAKDGIKYKPGSNTNWSDKHATFIRRGDDPYSPSRKRTYFFGT